MLVWSIASQKGGVGKTTTVASLAGFLQKEHLRVLAIDTDPHASLTSYLGFNESDLEHNLYDLYATDNLSRENVLKCVTHTRFLGLDLIASSMALATLDRTLSGRVGVGKILNKSLSLIEDCYDVVLVDCPPVLGALMVNALVASTLILVPTQTEFLALKGLEGMVRTFKIMHSADKGRKVNYLIIPTMFDKRTKASLLSLEHLKEHYPENLWQGFIPVDTLFRDSSAKNIPLPIMNASSRGSLAYRSLLCDLIAKELCDHKEKVSPATAAILTLDEEKISSKVNTEQVLTNTMESLLSSKEELNS